MWYICTKEYYSAIKRNEIGSFVEMCMDLETIIQSEIKFSQKEKNIYHILTCICGIQKNAIDYFICEREIEIQMQRTNYEHQIGKRRWWDQSGDWD